MSSLSVSLDTIERTKRAIMRSINSVKNEVLASLLENPSEEVFHRLNALIDEWKILLTKLSDNTEEMLETIDLSDLAPEEVESKEAEITNVLSAARIECAKAKGKFGVMVENFQRTKTPTQNVRQSLSGLNNSLLDDTKLSPFVKLPDLPVPKFDGDIKNFNEWFSLFMETIDKNPALTPVRKLFYLKQAMIGEAKHLLKDFRLEDTMYPIALQYVRDRYYNKRAIISGHFKDVAEFPAITVRNLRESLDKLNAIVRGIRICDIDTEKMSPLISYLVVIKLPERIRTDWENSVLDHSTYPAFQLLSTYLQNCVFVTESMHFEPARRNIARVRTSVEKLSDKP